MAKRVVLLVIPPVEELDLVGPVEVFGTANRLLGGSRPPYAVEVATTMLDRRIAGECGLSILADAHYRDVRGLADSTRGASGTRSRGFAHELSVLVVCGVGARLIRDPALLAWIARAATTARRLGAVCVGAFLLAAAGVLDGRRATVHWKYARELAQRFPRVAVDPRPIWIQDGTIYTSAGISAGIDLALAWVEQDFGPAAALKVARELVLFLRRPGGQDQLSVSLAAQAAHTRRIHQLQAWMMENLDQPLSVDRLADRVAMSPRNFARVFAEELGTTPARYLAQLRVEAARRLLEQTDKGLPEVASASGFGSADVMRRAFLRALGTTPAKYRGHFHAARGNAFSPIAARYHPLDGRSA